jgi:UDP-N-acetylmuramoyl-L-alanyl-D-glutamate--2,6-diaminopimelate ligase
VIRDRVQAIRTALREAQPGDLVLIAGKGHETTQTVGSQVHRHSDAAVVRESLVEAA